MFEGLLKMMRFGFVQRTIIGEKPPYEVAYRLTPFVRRFTAILDEACRLQDAVDRGAGLEASHAERATPRTVRQKPPTHLVSAHGAWRRR